MTWCLDERLFNVYTKLICPCYLLIWKGLNSLFFASVVVFTYLCGMVLENEPQKMACLRTNFSFRFDAAVYAVGAGFFLGICGISADSVCRCLAFVVEKIRQMRENRNKYLQLPCGLCYMLAIGTMGVLF